MSRPKPSLGYASRHEAAEALRAQGLKQREIAAALGIGVAGVGNLLRHSQHKSSRLSDQEKAALQRVARRRGLSIAGLKTTIVKAIVAGGQIEAVLDRAEETKDDR